MSALDDLAAALVKATPPKERDSASSFSGPMTVETGTVTAVAAPTATVQFATSALVIPAAIPGIHWIGTAPVVNDVVLVGIVGATRIILGKIS